MEASKNNATNNDTSNNKNITSNQPNGEYFDSPKHAPGGWVTPNPIPNKEIGKEVLNNAINQVRLIYEGKLIKFQPDPSTGQIHSYEVTNSFKEVPNDVLRQFRDDGLITKTQYNKYVKNK